MRTLEAALGSRRLGIALLLLLVAILLIAPQLYNVSATDQDLLATLQAPSLVHLAGTDQYGRDVLARLIAGGGLSLSASLLIVAGSLAIGFLAGISASMPGAIGALLTQFIDIALALPSLVMALVVVGLLGIGLGNLIIAFILVGWPYYARLARGFAQQRMKALDIRAARVFGVRERAILLYHVLPHAVRSLAIAAGLDLGYTLSALAGFSYLGLGAQAPAAEWGLMLRDAQMYFTVAPWLLLGPAAGIAWAVLATSLLTEELHAARVGQ